MKNDIVSVVSMMGEVVGRMKSEDDTSITLESPRLFVPAQDQQGGGFAPGISMTGEQELNEVTINKSVILAVVKTHETVASGWVSATSGIIV
jgi:hypothetical protein